MKRRRFTTIGVAVAAATGLGVALRPWRWLRGGEPPRNDAEALRQGLRLALPMLQLDDVVLESFTADMQRHGKGLRLTKNGRVRHDDVQKFLLSTDFFQHGADESRRPRYVAFYDPYITPCYNPLRQPRPR